MKKRIVVLTGAGMSAESGIPTFRDNDGLWNKYRIEDICTAEAWARQPGVLLDFYNTMRREYLHCDPNEGHRLVASLEADYDVQVITQNLDNLHERAGSSHVLHLHGEMMQCRADGPDDGRHYPLSPSDPDIRLGDVDAEGRQLRPHIVFFGEDVPNLSAAIDLMRTADVAVVIGTSLNVYPAAGLLAYVPAHAPVYLIDPKPTSSPYRQVHQIQAGAGEGMKKLTELLKAPSNPSAPL